MTDELIEQIKRDREAGTPGPWVAPYETYDNGWTLDTGSQNSYVGIGPACESEDMPPVAITAVEMAFGMDDVLDANARRIARVPEMEARIMSDADEIARLKKLLAAARQWNWIDFDDANPEDNEAFTPALCDLNRKINEALK